MVDIQGGSSAADNAAACLRGGGVAVLPTETVYGLFGRTDDAGALEQIYALKGRPADNPLIAHVLDVQMARALTSTWPSAAEAMCRRFWPGPLTIVVPRAPGVLDRAVAGLPTIAIRSPHHPVVRRVLEAVGHPLSAPSANRSGMVSPTCVEHVVCDFAGVPEAADLLVIEGGPCQTGLESTVIDLTGDMPRLLRAGSISIEAIKEVLSGGVRDDLPTTQGASPGTRRRHYATTTPLQLVDRDDLEDALSGERPICVIGPSWLAVTSPHRHLIMPDTHQAAARSLFGLLREADATDATQIIVVRPPLDSEWRAIHDRLERAAC
jgi:L-threonylcarbamoyladenylate synthase